MDAQPTPAPVLIAEAETEYTHTNADGRAIIVEESVRFLAHDDGTVSIELEQYDAMMSIDLTAAEWSALRSRIIGNADVGTGSDLL